MVQLRGQWGLQGSKGIRILEEKACSGYETCARSGTLSVSDFLGELSAGNSSKSNASRHDVT